MQDFWMPNGGGWGTNIPTSNPDSESWEIFWAPVYKFRATPWGESDENAGSE